MLILHNHQFLLIVVFHLANRVSAVFLNFHHSCMLSVLLIATLTKFLIKFSRHLFNYSLGLFNHNFYLCLNNSEELFDMGTTGI